MTAPLSHAIQRILRQHKIYNREVLHLYASDLHMEMIAKEQCTWEILISSEETHELLFREATRSERKHGYGIVARGYKAILFESDDTEEPRYLLVTLSTVRLPDLDFEFPFYHNYPFEEEDEALPEPLKLVIALQVARARLLQTEERLYLLPLKEVLYDEDPEAEAKEKLYNAPKPESLFAKIIPPQKPDPETAEILKDHDSREDRLLNLELPTEELAHILGSEGSGVLLHRDLETLNQLLESPLDEISEDMDVRLPLKPFDSVLIHDGEGHMALSQLADKPDLYTSDGSEDQTDLVFRNLPDDSVEYLLSRGCYYGTPFSFIPIAITDPIGE